MNALFQKKYPHFELFALRFEPDFLEKQQVFFQKLPFEMQTQAQNFFRIEDRWAYLAGKFLVEKALLPYSKKENFWENIQTNEYGKPYFLEKNVFFNLSHSHHYTVLAISEKMPIGIDIEAIRPIQYQDFESCFSPSDWEKIIGNSAVLPTFYQFWTWKESIIKADGRGLSIDLLDVILGEKYSYIAHKPQIRYHSEFLALDPDYVACVSFVQ